MAEQPKVFDLFFPSPPPLKDIACIRVALDICIGKMKKYTQNSNNLDLNLDFILPLNTVIPNAPPSVLPSIEKYVEKLINSIDHWLTNHFDKGITRSSYQIFHRFGDFVCDFDGTIDCEKTARKMIVSDAFSVEEKFKIACEYGFGEDIERIWPDVPASLYENEEDVQRNKVLYYWIWRFRGQLYKMKEFENGGLAATDRFIFNHYVGNDYWCGVNYYCNHLESNSWDRNAYAIFKSDKKKVFRYLLVKLNEAQLQKWMDPNGVLVMRKLLRSDYPGFNEDTFLALQIWNRVKHVMTKDAFIQLIRDILNTDKSNSDGRCSEAMSCWNEIWSSAPDFLKQSVIPDVLLVDGVARLISPDHYYFADLYSDDQLAHYQYDVHFHNGSFLLTLLKDFPVQYRRDFWELKWKSVLTNLSMEKVQALMNLCFTNEEEVEQFKRPNFAQFENIHPYCISLLKRACFQELLEYLRFCCKDEEIIRCWCRTLLQSDFKWTKSHLNDPHALNDFINFAFADVDAKFGRQFKRQYINAQKIVENYMLKGVHIGSDGLSEYYGSIATFRQIIDFVDTFETSKKKATELKKSIVPKVKVLINATNRKGIYFPNKVDEGVGEFMNWCLENDQDEIARFKESLNLDEVIQNRIRKEVFNCSDSHTKAHPFSGLGMEAGIRGRANYHRFERRKILKSATDSKGCSFLASFLQWYGGTAEEVQAVVRRYADDRVFVRLMSM